MSKHTVTAQRTYTDATRVNVGTFRAPLWVPAARITAERASAARARIAAGNRAGKFRRRAGAA